MHLQEFAKKSQTNFIRNVRPRLQRLFPALYKGKDGNQRLLRDTRFLKIACKGKIPDATADEGECLQELIRKGKSKVAQDTGMSASEETDNFLLYEEMEQSRLDRPDNIDEVKIAADPTPDSSQVTNKFPDTETIATNVVNSSLSCNSNSYTIPARPTMNPSSGFIYPPTAAFSTQPSMHYFDVQNSRFTHPYHYINAYPTYQYNYPQPLIQNQSTFTNANTHPHAELGLYQPTIISNTTTLNLSPSKDNSDQCKDAPRNRLLDLAETALQQ